MHQSTCFITLTIACLLCIASCDKPAFYSKSIDIPANWAYDDDIGFDVVIEDTMSVYEMQLIIRHLKDYRFENIYFKIYTDFPKSQDREELLNVDLASKAGKWMGRCGSKRCEVRVFLLEKFKFPEKGTYEFNFEQYTREENLMGVEGLELLIYKNDK